MKNKTDKKTEEEKVSCPNCHGLGEIPGQRGNHPSIMLTRTRTCSVCNGEGEITKKQSYEINQEHINKLLEKRITLS